MNILNRKFNKNILIYTYIICAIIMLMSKLVLAFIYGDIISDTFRIYFGNLFFASMRYIDYYMVVSFNSIGSLPMFLVLYFALLLVEKLDTFNHLSNKNIFIISILGIIFFVICRFLFDMILPFSLLYGILCGFILFFIKHIFKKFYEMISKFLSKYHIILIVVFGIVSILYFTFFI